MKPLNVETYRDLNLLNILATYDSEPTEIDNFNLGRTPSIVDKIARKLPLLNVKAVKRIQ